MSSEFAPEPEHPDYHLVDDAWDDHNTCRECSLREGAECSIDGQEVFSDTPSCGEFIEEEE